MPLIRWRPFEDDFDNFLEHAHNHHEQGDLAVDIYDKDDALIVNMAIAGVDPDKIDITVEDNALRISGVREEKEEIEERHYYRKEIKRGSFERYISLPTAVIADEVRAEVEDGILSVYLPKKKASKASKVKVNKKK